MTNPETSAQRPPMGEKIHSVLASHRKNAVVDGLFIGSIAAASALLGGPIVMTARALGGGLMAAIALKYMRDRAGEIQWLRDRLDQSRPISYTPQA